MLALDEAFYAARAHADVLAKDVELASTRQEHIRLTIRAREADTLADSLRRIVEDNPIL